MGLFSNVKDSRRLVDAQYVTEGHYYVRINKCKQGQSRPPKNRQFACVETTVLHHVLPPSPGTVAVGRDMTHMVMADSEYFGSEIRTFVAAIAGLQFEAVSEEDCDLVFDVNEIPGQPDGKGDQPFGGIIAEVSARDVETRAGGNFTKVSWIRQVPAKVLKDVIAPDIEKAYFPNGMLDQMIEAEAAAAQSA